MTSFGRLASNYVEAGWLLAAAAAALLFQVVSTRSFDFPRVTLLQILTPWLLAAAGVALVAGVDRVGRAGRGGLLGPRALPWTVAGALAGSYVLSTALSIAPVTSLWGSRFNSEGAATGLAYATLLAIVATFMRRPDQVARLIDLMLLASVPVALYGLAQYVGYDPLAAAMSVQLVGGRIVSSLGNPILAGGYAAILMPITLARAIGTLRRLRLAGEGAGGSAGARERGSAGTRGGERAGEASSSRDVEPARTHALPLPSRPLGAASGVGAVVVLQAGALALFLWAASSYPQLWWVAPIVLVLFVFPALVVPRAAPSGRAGLLLAAGAYLSLFLLQFLLFYLARSRGPFVAAPIALGLTLFLLYRSRRTRLALGAIGLVGSLVVLAVVGIPALARAYPALTGSPAVGLVERLSGPSNTVSSRWLIWSGVLDLALGRHDVGVEGDPLNPVRPLIGYGPETLAVTYEKVATAAAREAESFRISRAHDEPLDFLATRGLIGLGVWAFTLGALALSAWRARERVGLDSALAGAAGGAAAYAIEQLFEPNDPSLSIHFWLLAGIVMSRACQMPVEGEPAAERGGDPAQGRPGQNGRDVESAVLIGSPAGAQGASGRGRRRDRGRGSQARPAAGAASRLLASSQAHPQGATLRIAVGATLGFLGALVAMYAILGGGYDTLGWLLIGWLGLAMAGLAAAFLPGSGNLSRADLARGLLVAIPLVLVSTLVSLQPFRRFEADAYGKYGLEAARRGDLVNGFALSRNGVLLAPDDELLYSNLARVLAAIANAVPDQATRSEFRPTTQLVFGIQPQQVATLGKRELLRLTATVLERAVEIAPLEPDNRLNLAIVHRALGDLGEADHYRQAREQLEILTRLSPTQSLYGQELAALVGRGG